MSSTQTYIPASAAQGGLSHAVNAGLNAGVASLASMAVVGVGVAAITLAGPAIQRGVEWAWNGIDEGVSDAYHWVGRQFG